MKRIALCLALGLACTQAPAVGRLADVTVTDRDTGRTLEVHYHNGEYWVAGRPGARYAINIRNHGDRRVLAVTSVDGVNVVTGETAAFDQSGYVFDPWSGYGIDGWRKSDSQVAAFTFTAVPKSYAARTGRPDNVGVIGVALFRELPRIRYEAPPAALSTPAPAPPVPTAPARESAQSAAEVAAADAAGKSAEARRDRSTVAQALGTGHGAREQSRARRVNFERESAQPDEIIRIRYDSRANLLAMGVIREPRPQPPRAPQPFPDQRAYGFVPDP